MANFQPGRATAPVSQVEITISCKNLRDRDMFSKSDPMAVVFMKEVGTARYSEIARTERIQNSLDPDFARKITLDYYFEQQQVLKFEIYDVDSASASLSSHDFLGSIECSLGEIVGARGGKIHRNLIAGQHAMKTGSIILSAEEVAGNKQIAIMQWKGTKLDKKDFLGKSDPFIQIFRIEADGSTTIAFRSETIQNTLNPVWKPFRIPVRALCGDNIDRHDLIGSFETTFRRLSQGANNSQNVYDLINPKKKAKKKDYKNSGQLHLSMFSVETEYSFLEFIRGGTQVHFSVAVDFTASNGDPHDPNSLHFIHPHQPNQYMIALKAVGEIIQDYDYDKMFPALGFGARLPPGGELSHEFFLNFTNDPHCFGVNGILDAYRRTVTSVQLYGPTNFSPVINHVARFAANSRDGSHYFVLLIITDGAITDMDNTIDAIVNASSLPMSIIIVGVGGADFTAMEILDADKARLQRNGRVAQRDIVQFVPMRKYVNGVTHDLSQSRLAKDVLAEVPLQLTKYMQMIGMKPRPPLQADVSRPAPSVPANPTGVPGAPGMPDTAPSHGPPPPAGGPAPPPQFQQGGVGGAYPSMPPAAAPGQQPPPPPQFQQGGGGAYPPVAPAPYGQQPAPSAYPPSTGGYPPQAGYPPPPAQYGQQPPAYPAGAPPPPGSQFPQQQGPSAGQYSQQGPYQPNYYGSTRPSAP